MTNQFQEPGEEGLNLTELGVPGRDSGSNMSPPTLLLSVIVVPE